MEENQNTNEQGHPKEVIAIKAKELSEPLIKETPTPSTNETKEEAPILTTQPQTINHKQETAEMEVHKHPHHVMHKKKWSEYLLEFFMLFLAVFLGFVAENIREHAVEKERAEHYAKSLYHDVVEDTVRLTEAINISRDIALKTDTLRDLCRGKEIKDVTGGAIYYYSRYAFRRWGFQPTNATLEQLKNSGSLRFFGNYELEDAINRYDQSIRWLVSTSQIDLETVSNGTPYLYELFDANIMDSVLSYKTPRIFINAFITHQQKLVTYDRQKWTGYLNYAAHRGEGLNGLLRVGYLPALENARKVIAILKEKYHLD